MSSPRHEIACTGSAEVYKNPWMTVREDRIVRPDGSEGLYGVVEKPDFAISAALQEDHLFLVEQYRYPVKKRFWEFPQGSWEDRVTDPLTLARAELHEETGLLAGSMLHAGHLFLAYGYSTQGYDIFLATDLEQQEVTLAPEESGLITKAFSIADVETMIREGIVKDASTVAAFGLLKLKGLL